MLYSTTSNSFVQAVSLCRSISTSVDVPAVWSMVQTTLACPATAGGTIASCLTKSWKPPPVTYSARIGLAAAARRSRRFGGCLPPM